MLKSYAGEKITQIMKKTMVGFVSAESSVCHCLLSGSNPGDVRWCPSLGLGSLFETTSDPQSVAVSFRLGWSPLFCPPGFPSAQDLSLIHI